MDQHTASPFRTHCGARGVEGAQHLIENGEVVPSDPGWPDAMSNPGALAGWPDPSQPFFPPPTPTAPVGPHGTTALPVAESGLFPLSPVIGWQCPSSTSESLHGSEGSSSVSGPLIASRQSGHTQQQELQSSFLVSGASPTALQNPWGGPDSPNFEGHGSLAWSFASCGISPGLLASHEPIFSDQTGGGSEAGYSVPDTMTSHFEQHETKNKSSSEEDALDAMSVSFSATPTTELAAAAGPSKRDDGGGKSKRRGGSFTKHRERPSETADERKTRTSHNLVEKQYRNRLNAQFDNLLQALPEEMRSPTLVTARPDGVVGGAVDLGTKRLSKGEVLEMSTAYIRSLRSECESLERQRGELLRSMEQIQDAIRKRDMSGMPNVLSVPSTANSDSGIGHGTNIDESGGDVEP